MSDPEPVMDQWATHLPALVAAATATSGPVLECGVGLWSTPILHALCAPTKRALVSVEANENWLRRFAMLGSTSHEMRLVTGWENVSALNLWTPDKIHDGPDPRGGRWALAFVDHGYAPRGPVVTALRDRAELIVMHDSECDYCGYSEPLRAFAWCYTHTHSPAWTTIAGMGEPPPWLTALQPGHFGVPVPYR